MPYRNLLHLAPILKLDKCREEAVHAREHRDSLGVVRVEDLQRAAGVCCPVVSEHFAESVGKLALEVFPGGILAVCPDSHNQRVFICVWEQKVKVLRSSLKVRVYVSYKRGEGVVESGLDGSAEASTLFQGEIVEVLPPGALVLNHFQGLVRTAVVDEKYACALVLCRIDILVQSFCQPRDVSLLVEDWRDYGETVICCLVHNPQI